MEGGEGTDLSLYSGVVMMSPPSAMIRLTSSVPWSCGDCSVTTSPRSSEPAFTAHLDNHSQSSGYGVASPGEVAGFNVG